ncbi:MAG: type II toxin-antitoxin system RelE/ParE family toxin [Pseudomonadota bacterium]
MRVRWTARALKQLETTLEYLHHEDPHAANIVAERLYTAERFLANNPTVGRPGRISDTREWVVTGAPYLLGYTLMNDELIILALLHSKQQWPKQFDQTD